MTPRMMSNTLFLKISYCQRVGNLSSFPHNLFRRAWPGRRGWAVSPVPERFWPGGNGRQIRAQELAQTLNSDVLRESLLRIQAANIVMIIDAFNSAASVEGAGFKPGPMGSRGLGQLAYDKGMRILTASQSEGVAFKSGVLSHGALSYAMFWEGLMANGADTAPVDSRITFSELLGYARDRVPTLYEEIMTDSFQALQLAGNLRALFSDNQPLGFIFPFFKKMVVLFYLKFNNILEMILIGLTLPSLEKR